MNIYWSGLSADGLDKQKDSVQRHDVLGQRLYYSHIYICFLMYMGTVNQCSETGMRSLDPFIILLAERHCRA